jgi:hypothetical protein
MVSVYFQVASNPTTHQQTLEIPIVVIDVIDVIDVTEIR